MRCHSGFWWGNRPIGTPRSRWEDIQKVGWRGMDCNDLPQDGGGQLTVVNPVMNFQVPKNVGNFLST